MSATVSERLIGFMRAQLQAGLPAPVLHEANRLLLNQLKASVGATRHPAVRLLADWASESGHGGKHAAHILWLGGNATPDAACVVNGALFEVLDFNDTYIPTFMHATSGVLPAALATAEICNSSGAQLLVALALGIEVELACATILMPTGYFRGFVPGGLVGAVGGAAASGLLRGLDDTRMRHALGIAMCSAFGTYESVGGGTLSYIMGSTARSGFLAADHAARGLDAPRSAFEGEKGMLSAHSDEKSEKIETVLASMAPGMDHRWRIFGNSYKTVPTETITHAPIECALALRARAGDRVVRRMRFGVEALTVKIADERRARFGIPASELEARFDLRFCAAAAWTRGRFTLAEMREDAYRDPAILDLRDRIELAADPMHRDFEGATLEVLFADGTSERMVVPAFRGTPNNPLTDEELSAVFRLAARDVLDPTRADAILTAGWGLRDAPSVAPLLSLLVLDAKEPS